MNTKENFQVYNKFNPCSKKPSVNSTTVKVRSHLRKHWFLLKSAVISSGTGWAPDDYCVFSIEEKQQIQNCFCVVESLVLFNCNQLWSVEIEKKVTKLYDYKNCVPGLHINIRTTADLERTFEQQLKFLSIPSNLSFAADACLLRIFEGQICVISRCIKQMQVNDFHVCYVFQVV